MGINLQRTPLTSDGKPIHLSNMFPGNVNINYPGEGDDITNGTLRGGAAFEYNGSSVGSTDIEWQFKDWRYMAGGELIYTGADLGDYISYRNYAPATSGTSVTAGTGDHAKIDTGLGFNMWAPAGTPGAGSADWDIDLTETLNENVDFSKVVPVPSDDQTGLYDWDPDTEAVTINEDGKGKFDLFDAEIQLTEFVSKARMLGTNGITLTVPAIKPKRILPHWKHKVTIYQAGTHTLKACWFLYTGLPVTV